MSFIFHIIVLSPPLTSGFETLCTRINWRALYNISCWVLSQDSDSQNSTIYISNYLQLWSDIDAFFSRNYTLRLTRLDSTEVQLSSPFIVSSISPQSTVSFLDTSSLQNLNFFCVLKVAIMGDELVTIGNQNDSQRFYLEV